MKLAPLGAFGAMAYAIGKYGVSTLTSLGSLILLFYATSALFVVVVLGLGHGSTSKLNIFKLLRYLKEELLLILGTSTAEPALPGLMRKWSTPASRRSTVGLVVPTGYSFNLDGAAIYLSLAAVYLAQATDTDLTIGQQIGLLAIMLLTSKGAAGVAGGGFIALAATLSTVGTIPRRRHHADLRHRQVHVRVPGPGQLHRQRRRHPVHRQVGPGLDFDRVRRVLDSEPVPDLPAEIDATDEPAGRREHRARRRLHRRPAPPRSTTSPLRYAVEDEVRKLKTGRPVPISAATWSATRPSPTGARPARRSRRGTTTRPDERPTTAGTGLASPDTVHRHRSTKREGHEGSHRTGQVQGQPHRRRGGRPPRRGPGRSAASSTRGLPLADGGDGSVAPPSPPASVRSQSPSPGPPANGTPPRSPSTAPPPSSRSPTPAACTPCPAACSAPLTPPAAGVGQTPSAAALQLAASGSCWPSAGRPAPTAARGMLAALGAAFRDATGQPLDRRRRHPAPDPHHRPHRPARPDRHRDRHRQRRQNPLTGPDGAAAVYGPQKGATPARSPHLDAGLTHLVEPGRIRRQRRRAARRTPGAGRRRRARVRRTAARRHDRSPAPTTSSTCCSSTPTCRAAISSSPAKDASTTRPCTASSPRSSPERAGTGPGHRRRRPQRHQRRRAAPNGHRTRCTPSPTYTTGNPASDPHSVARLFDELGPDHPLPPSPLTGHADPRQPSRDPPSAPHPRRGRIVLHDRAGHARASAPAPTWSRPAWTSPGSTSATANMPNTSRSTGRSGAADRQAARSASSPICRGRRSGSAGSPTVRCGVAHRRAGA